MNYKNVLLYVVVLFIIGAQSFAAAPAKPKEFSFSNNTDFPLFYTAKIQNGPSPKYIDFKMIKPNETKDFNPFVTAGHYFYVTFANCSNPQGAAFSFNLGQGNYTLWYSGGFFPLDHPDYHLLPIKGDSDKKILPIKGDSDKKKFIIEYNSGKHRNYTTSETSVPTGNNTTDAYPTKIRNLSKTRFFYTWRKTDAWDRFKEKHGKEETYTLVEPNNEEIRPRSGDKLVILAEVCFNDKMSLITKKFKIGKENKALDVRILPSGDIEVENSQQEGRPATVHNIASIAAMQKQQQENQQPESQPAANNVLTKPTIAATPQTGERYIIEDRQEDENEPGAM